MSENEKEMDFSCSLEEKGSSERKMLGENICPNCGVPLILRRTRNGYIYGCPNYPLCDYVKNVSSQGVTVLMVMPDTSCPECGSPMAVKKSRYGLFIGCSNYPECNYIHMEKEENPIACPVCGGGVLRHHSTKFGRSFYSCSNFRICRFSLNYRPVSRECPECGFPLMVLRRGKNRQYLQCADRKCGHRIPLDDSDLLQSG